MMSWILNPKVDRNALGSIRNVHPWLQYLQSGGILLFKSAYKIQRGVFLRLWQIVPLWYMTKIHNKLQSFSYRHFKTLQQQNLTVYAGTGIINLLYFTYLIYNLKKQREKTFITVQKATWWCPWVTFLMFHFIKDLICQCSA